LSLPVLVGEGERKNVFKKPYNGTVPIHGKLFPPPKKRGVGGRKSDFSSSGKKKRKENNDL